MSYSNKIWQSLSQCANGTGEEFDWHAVDRKGYLAVLTTAGLGPVPASIWAHRDELNELVSAISNLPSISTYEQVFVESGDHREWCAYASKGLFAFDYHDVHRKSRLHRYDLISRPQQLVQAASLLPELNLRWLPVLDLDFAVCSFLLDSDVQ